MKPFSARELLLSHQLPVFTAKDLARLTGSPPRRTRYFLEQQAKQGLLVRLKRGLYALTTDLPGEEVIANRLYAPSYISFEYALAYYQIIPEMAYEVTCATSNSQYGQGVVDW